MGKVIGIDLGTTNSVVAVMEGGEPKVIINEEGSRLTPSVVAFTKEGERLVGQIAKRQAITNPENTVYSIKRFMGRKYSEVQQEIKTVPFKVIEGPNGDATVEIQGKKYSPPEIGAMVLQKLKKAAEAYLGEEVKEAVITVPAYFNDAQRQATKDAGRIAGLGVKRIINEPTASALAYGLDKKKNHVIAVYDFGGGTFDISCLEVGDNIIEVKSTNGDTHLGGDDIDQRVVNWLVDEFRKETGIDVSKDKMVIQRLKDAAEKAKVELSSVMETEINLPFLTADASGPKHLNIRLSRSKLEQMMADLIERSHGPLLQALKDAKLSPDKVDEVVLVGGSTRIPRVQDMVRELFKKEPYKGVNPDEVVALGAAVQAGVLAGEVKDILLLDVTPLSLGVETLGGVMTVLITRNTTIPTRKSELFTTAEDSQTSVEIHVLQGERPMARDNRTLGRFHLVGIPSAPRGLPQIEVSFDIDANGILNVSAKDMATSKAQTITITAGSGITEQDIQRMVKESEAHSDEDRKRRELIEARNRLDGMIYNLDKTKNENKDKLSPDEIKQIEDAVAEGRKVIGSDDKAQIDAALESVTRASHRMAETLYKSRTQGGGPQGPGPQPGQQPPPGGPQPEAGGPGPVIDAEYEDPSKK